MKEVFHVFTRHLPSEINEHRRNPKTHMLVIAVFILHLKVPVVEVDGWNVGVARVDDRADPRSEEGELLVIR